MIHYITLQGLGQPWVGNELGVLDSNSVPFTLHAMRTPEHELFESEWAARIQSSARIIYPLPLMRFAAALVCAPVLFWRRWCAAAWNALFASRESLRARVTALAHFAVAAYWACQNRKERMSHIHCQWAHASATIGMYASWLLDVPYSFTGHAVDLFRDRVALEDKVARAAFIVCISTFHRDFFKELGAGDEQLKIVYCGIDVSHFVPRGNAVEHEDTLRIRSSGRLVDKKGFDVLVRACAILRDRGLEFECVIGGSGPLETDLNRLIREHSLGARVRVTGEPIKQEDIPKFMHSGSVYCLPCVWAKDNDVDGLPQMLMEAMACGLPVVSTQLVGIPDLVIHEQTGLLVEPNNAEQLADAIARLDADRGLADRLAASGREMVLRKFDLSTCLEPLISEFRRRLMDDTPVVISSEAPSNLVGPQA